MRKTSTSAESQNKPTVAIKSTPSNTYKSSYWNSGTHADLLDAYVQSCKELANVDDNEVKRVVDKYAKMLAGSIDMPRLTKYHESTKQWPGTSLIMNGEQFNTSDIAKQLLGIAKIIIKPFTNNHSSLEQISNVVECVYLKVAYACIVKVYNLLCEIDQYKRGIKYDIMSSDELRDYTISQIGHVAANAKTIKAILERINPSAAAPVRLTAIANMPMTPRPSTASTLRPKTRGTSARPFSPQMINDLKQYIDVNTNGHFNRVFSVVVQNLELLKVPCIMSAYDQLLLNIVENMGNDTKEVFKKDKLDAAYSSTNKACAYLQNKKDMFNRLIDPHVADEMKFADTPFFMIIIIIREYYATLVYAIMHAWQTFFSRFAIFQEGPGVLVERKEDMEDMDDDNDSNINDFVNHIKCIHIHYVTLIQQTLSYMSLNDVINDNEFILTLQDSTYKLPTTWLDKIDGLNKSNWFNTKFSMEVVQAVTFHHKMVKDNTFRNKLETMLVGITKQNYNDKMPKNVKLTWKSVMETLSSLHIVCRKNQFDGSSYTSYMKSYNNNDSAWDLDKTTYANLLNQQILNMRYLQFLNDANKPIEGLQEQIAFLLITVMINYKIDVQILNSIIDNTSCKLNAQPVEGIEFNLEYVIRSWENFMSLFKKGNCLDGSTRLIQLAKLIDEHLQKKSVGKKSLFSFLKPVKSDFVRLPKAMLDNNNRTEYISFDLSVAMLEGLHWYTNTFFKSSGPVYKQLLKSHAFVKIVDSFRRSESHGVFFKRMIIKYYRHYLDMYSFYLYLSIKPKI